MALILLPKRDIAGFRISKNTFSKTSVDTCYALCRPLYHGIPRVLELFQ